MYIVYDRYQRPTNGNDKYEEELNHHTNFMPVPDFKPTWLVRVSDMKVIPGSSINEHYWTLSYSWSQSGEIIHKGTEEYERVDEGQHQIISHRYGDKDLTAGQQDIPWYWPSGETSEYIYRLVNRDTEELRVKRIDGATKAIRYVRFEELIQQICKDFRIKYIWFDQLCINQGDHDEKIREIKQMHLIYTYARYTLALIPELHTTYEKNGDKYWSDVGAIARSQWATRMWTLEETYMSRNILFVGSNEHVWSCDWERPDDFFNNIKRLSYSKDHTWKACTVLCYARPRTSTKEHDKVFALVQFFPEIKDYITFNYRQSVRDLMVQFYGLLLAHDQSVLLFGVPHDDIKHSSKDSAIVKPADAIQLPSWIGTSGRHIPEKGIYLQHYMYNKNPIKVMGDCVQLTSTFITIQIEATASVDGEFPLLYSQDTKGGLCVILSDKAHSSALSGSVDSLVAAPATENVKYFDSYSDSFNLRATHFLPIATEGDNFISTLSNPTRNLGFLSITEYCSKCFIPKKLLFRYVNYKIYPVIKEDKDHYKVIGVCMIYEGCSFDPALEQDSYVFDIY